MLGLRRMQIIAQVFPLKKWEAVPLRLPSLAYILAELPLGSDNMWGEPKNRVDRQPVLFCESRNLEHLLFVLLHCFLGSRAYSYFSE